MLEVAVDRCARCGHEPLVLTDVPAGEQNVYLVQTATRTTVMGGDRHLWSEHSIVCGYCVSGLKYEPGTRRYQLLLKGRTMYDCAWCCCIGSLDKKCSWCDLPNNLMPVRVYERDRLRGLVYESAPKAISIAAIWVDF